MFTFFKFCINSTTALEYTKVVFPVKLISQLSKVMFIIILQARPAQHSLRATGRKRMYCVCVQNWNELVANKRCNSSYVNLFLRFVFIVDIIVNACNVPAF